MDHFTPASVVEDVMLTFLELTRDTIIAVDMPPGEEREKRLREIAAEARSLLGVE